MKDHDECIDHPHVACVQKLVTFGPPTLPLAYISLRRITFIDIRLLEQQLTKRNFAIELK